MKFKLNTKAFRLVILYVGTTYKPVGTSGCKLVLGEILQVVISIYYHPSCTTTSTTFIYSCITFIKEMDQILCYCFCSGIVLNNSFPDMYRMKQPWLNPLNQEVRISFSFSQNVAKVLKKMLSFLV